MRVKCLAKEGKNTTSPARARTQAAPFRVDFKQALRMGFLLLNSWGRGGGGGVRERRACNGPCTISVLSLFPLD